jgi:hypothetical protein
MTIGNGAMLPLSGTITNSGTISLGSTGSETLLQLIQYGITLQGGGHVVLSDNPENIISGSLPSVTFTNVDNTISGAGRLGGGSLTMTNAGTIIANGINALVIDTGSNVVTNSGTLEATGLGGLVIAGSIASNGLILAQGSGVMIGGNLSGTGHVELSGASTVEFGGSSANAIDLDADASGLIIFDTAGTFSGAISGLNADDRIDLRGLGFGANSTLNYLNQGSGGLLTISDGVHSVQLHFVGTYSSSDFALSSDGHGGVLLTNTYDAIIG